VNNAQEEVYSMTIHENRYSSKHILHDCDPLRSATMCYPNIRSRMVRELRDGGFGVQNLLNVLIVGAIMFMGHVHVSTDVRGLGADFARGHGTLANLPDLSMANFHYGVTNGLNVEAMTELCASTGVINMGVHRGHLYVMFKWMVSMERSNMQQHVT